MAWPARDVPTWHRKQGEIQIEAKFSQKNWRNFTFAQSMRIVFSRHGEKNQPVSLEIWAAIKCFSSIFSLQIPSPLLSSTYKFGPVYGKALLPTLFLGKNVSITLPPWDILPFRRLPLFLPVHNNIIHTCHCSFIN